MNVNDVSVEDHQNDNGIKQLVFGENVRSVGTFAFRNCDNLQEIVFNEGLEKIKTCAFGGCSSLKRVVFPSTLKELGAGAFRDCANLREVKFVDGGIHNLTVGPYVFANCPNGEDHRISIENECERRKGRALYRIVKQMGMDDHFQQWSRDYEKAIKGFSAVKDWMNASEDALEDLIFKPGNGLALAGQGAMSRLKWEQTKNNPRYREICAEICACADKDEYLKIEEGVRKGFLELTKEERINGRNGEITEITHPLLYNRMVCGLRPDLVVAIPDFGSLKVVYAWLRRNHFKIDVVANDNDAGIWFSMAASVRKCVLHYLQIGGCYNEDDVIVVWYIAMLYREYQAPLNNARREIFRGFLNEAGFTI